MKDVSVEDDVKETMKRDRIDHQENRVVNKKSKSNSEEDDDQDGEIWDAVSNAWDHYRNYLNSSEDGESGDIDELLELIEILGPFVPLPSNNRSDDKKNPEALSLNDVTKSYGSIESLLPVLMSLSYSHLGSHAIAESLIKMNHCNGCNDTNNGPKENLNTPSSDIASVLLDDDPPEKYLEKSLMYFSGNASSLSIYANYKRMNILDSQENICKMYEVASGNANCIRAGAMYLLEKDEAEIDNVCKEWIELLLLNGVCCSEYVIDDEETNKDGNDTSTAEQEDNDIKNEEEDMEDDEEEEEDGYFSISQVEATSSFMAALLNSTLGNHDKALKYLRKFKVTHRIHPNVWNRCLTIDTNKKTIDDNFLFEPLSFRSSTGTKDSGILPPQLYNRMCEVFAPTASYWRESDYNNRGYYSYFHDLSEDNIPKNLIEDVVINHLLPRIQHLAKDQKIVGFEWWTHTRPVAANLGHQLHFDTDETLLAQDNQITHPIISSVLYLSSSTHSIDAAGSTIVFHQNPHSKVVGDKAWISAAMDNSFMAFPGNALHGVLPCRGTTEHQQHQEKQHRLTFMVGFWTRKVPDRMKNRHLYGPCGPLPPSSKVNSWVQEIEKGYMKKNYFQENMQNKIKTISLPVATPCWEVIPYNEDKNDNQDELTLELPKGLDHRFFVHDAPICFKQSLFQKENMF